MRVPAHHQWVYKIATRAQMVVLRDAAGAPDGIGAVSHWDGAPVDLADGFIHFSTGDQLAGTLSRHFQDVDEVWVLGIRVTDLPAGQLVWETSRGGDLFPHLYGKMGLHQVSQVHHLTRAATGAFVVPALEP